MITRFPAALGIAASLLSGCASSPSAQKAVPRQNDPYAFLSPSDTYTQLGVQYMEGGMLDVALTDLQRAVELDPNNNEAYNALGVLYERLNRPADAESQFAKALSLNPENYSARNNYGRFLCHQGRYEQGMTQFQKVIVSPIYRQPWLPLTNAGLCARSVKKNREAEDYFRKALEKNPRFPPALLEMARVSLESGQALAARGFLQRYQEVAEDTPDSLWLGAQIERALGERDAAIDYVRRLRKQFPDSPEAMQARTQAASP